MQKIIKSDFTLDIMHDSYYTQSQSVAIVDNRAHNLKNEIRTIL